MQRAHAAADGIPDDECDEVAAFGKIDLLCDVEPARRCGGVKREAHAIDGLSDAFAVRIECEGSKEELVRDVSRFYSSSHDRFTYGSSFINFNLPQFYQIVNTGDRFQVIPFRSQTLTQLCATQPDNDNGDFQPRYQMH